jgi:hypothetical protein
MVQHSYFSTTRRKKIRTTKRKGMHQEFITTVQLNFSKQKNISIISWLTGQE